MKTFNVYKYLILFSVISVFFFTFTTSVYADIFDTACSQYGGPTPQYNCTYGYDCPSTYNGAPLSYGYGPDGYYCNNGFSNQPCQWTCDIHANFDTTYTYINSMGVTDYMGVNYFCSKSNPPWTYGTCAAYHIVPPTSVSCDPTACLNSYYTNACNTGTCMVGNCNNTSDPACVPGTGPGSQCYSIDNGACRTPPPPAAVCGNGVCEAGEDIYNCTIDCATGFYDMSLAPSSQSVNKGSQATYNLTFSTTGFFSGTIHLTSNNCPTGATCTLGSSNVFVQSGASNPTVPVTVTTAANTSLGQAVVGILGDWFNGLITRQANAWITVSLAPINGVVGTASKTYPYNATSYGTDTFCVSGTVSPASPAFPTQGGSVTWTCLGQNGGSNAVGTATRNSPPVTLSVNVIASGQGTITSTSNPSQTNINCGPTCSATYDVGTVVTLTATPSSGRIFIGWSGDCSGTTNTCTLTVNAAKSVTAKFAVNPNFREF